MTIRSSSLTRPPLSQHNYSICLHMLFTLRYAAASRSSTGVWKHWL